MTQHILGFHFCLTFQVFCLPKNWRMSQLKKREDILTLYQSNQVPPSKISEQIGVFLATVYRTIKRVEEGASLEHKIGAGRKPNKREKIKRSVVQLVRRDKSKTVREIAAHITKKGDVSVSKDTVNRCLRKLRYTKPYPSMVPLLTEKNRLKRLDWARKYKNKHWCHAIFADEASFWLHRGVVRLWTKPGEINYRPMVEHSAKVREWAAFSSMGTFLLCIFTENLTGDLFVKILEWHLIDQAETFHGNRWFLVQDNDPKHTSKVVRTWMDTNMKKNQFEWPSQSRSLSYREHLWLAKASVD